MPLGEADTRAKLIDPALHARGWTEDLIRRETAGAVEIVGERPRRRTRGRVDYTLRVSPTYLAKAPVAAGPGQLPRIRLEEVAAVEVDLPDLDRQRSILRSLREQMAVMERARAAAEAQLQAIGATNQALLRRVFGGP